MIWTDLLLATLIMAGAYFIGRRWAWKEFKKPVGTDHATPLAWRCTVLAMGLVVCAAWLRWTGSSMWLLVACAALAWGVFGSEHVYRLNTLRGLDWRYMSPGNVWDRVWMRTVAKLSRYNAAIAQHNGIYNCKESTYRITVPEPNGVVVWDVLVSYYKGQIHKAGSRAMVFRLSIAGMALITFVVFALKPLFHG